MPIRPEFRHHYRGPQWEDACAIVDARAGGLCEFCSKPENVCVMVTRDGTGRWNRAIVEAMFERGSAVSYLASTVERRVKESRSKAVKAAWYRGWWRPTGELDAFSRFLASLANPVPEPEPPSSGRLYLITRALTHAHLNHTPGDDRPENLAALCEYCHLHYDRNHHRDMRAARKDSERPLLAAVSA